MGSPTEQPLLVIVPVAVRCSVLQCVAGCIRVNTDVLQRLQVRFARVSLQHTATHCNALQHTATHCNTLQHPATHCNTPQHTATHPLMPCKGSRYDLRALAIEG